MLQELAGVAGKMGRGASEVKSGRSVDGDERGLCTGDCRGRDAYPRGDGAVWKARAVDGGGVMLKSVEGGVTLAVRALPGAKKKTAVLGVYCEGEKARLKIAVQAPPIDGRANSALIEFLADMFGLPKSYVELVNGELSRSKVFLLRGVTAGKAEALLAKWR